jgi:hypothetical protein
MPSAESAAPSGDEHRASATKSAVGASARRLITGPTGRSVPQRRARGWPDVAQRVFTRHPRASHAAAHPVRIVSLRALERTDDTLMLRLLAAELTTATAAALRRRARGDARLAPLMHAVFEHLTDLLQVAPGGVAMLDVSTEVKKYVEWLKRSGYRKGIREGINRGEQGGEQRGVQQGMQQGLAPLLRLFSRRLDRALTDDERAAVTARLITLGADRLGDVVLDLSAPELAVWLADPAAR